MKNTILILTTTALTTAASASITDHLLYEQTSPTAQGDGASVYYSNPTNNQTMYDQFRFDDESSIEGIGFWGTLYNDATITVTIYEQDQSTGLLGDMAFTQQFVTQDLESEITVPVWDDFWFADESHVIAEFDQAFTAEQGQTYWLAITGDTLFSWTFGATTGNNNTLYSNTAQDDFWNPTDIGLDATNLAFSIYGTPTPAPSAMITMGILGLGLSRRRRVC